MNLRFLAIPFLFSPLAPLALIILARPPKVRRMRYPCVNPLTGEKRWTTDPINPARGLVPVDGQEGGRVMWRRRGGKLVVKR